ncbi:hypothetical protein FPV67DRAFT_1452959 [Lyophyllum atratum]|nr:hypothetical protein FPV67DRAFT_1452959 [Lyophyllum atratum]
MTLHKQRKDPVKHYWQMLSNFPSHSTYPNSHFLRVARWQDLYMLQEDRLVEENVVKRKVAKVPYIVANKSADGNKSNAMLDTDVSQEKEVKVQETHYKTEAGHGRRKRRSQRRRRALQEDKKNLMPVEAADLRLITMSPKISSSAQFPPLPRSRQSLADPIYTLPWSTLLAAGCRPDFQLLFLAVSDMSMGSKIPSCADDYYGVRALYDVAKPRTAMTTTYTLPPPFLSCHHQLSLLPSTSSPVIVTQPAPPLIPNIDMRPLTPRFDGFLKGILADCPVQQLCVAVKQQEHPTRRVVLQRTGLLPPLKLKWKQLLRRVAKVPRILLKVTPLEKILFLSSLGLPTSANTAEENTSAPVTRTTPKMSYSQAACTLPKTTPIGPRNTVIFKMKPKPAPKVKVTKTAPTKASAAAAESQVQAGTTKSAPAKVQAAAAEALTKAGTTSAQETLMPAPKTKVIKSTPAKVQVALAKALMTTSAQETLSDVLTEKLEPGTRLVLTMMLSPKLMVVPPRGQLLRKPRLPTSRLGSLYKRKATTASKAQGTKETPTSRVLQPTAKEIQGKAAPTQSVIKARKPANAPGKGPSIGAGQYKTCPVFQAPHVLTLRDPGHEGNDIRAPNPLITSFTLLTYICCPDCPSSIPPCPSRSHHAITNNHLSPAAKPTMPQDLFSPDFEEPEPEITCWHNSGDPDYNSDANIFVQGDEYDFRTLDNAPIMFQTPLEELLESEHAENYEYYQILHKNEE